MRGEFFMLILRSEPSSEYLQSETKSEFHVFHGRGNQFALIDGDVYSYGIRIQSKQE